MSEFYAHITPRWFVMGSSAYATSHPIPLAYVYSKRYGEPIPVVNPVPSQLSTQDLLSSQNLVPAIRKRYVSVF